jgi:tripartite-type tricarboxylate transporter receptor subunit TctC
VYGELFKMMTGVDILPTSLEHIRAGKLRALAVTSATRSAVLPDIPTVGKFVPGYEAMTWQGIGVPRNTPTEIINKLNKEINAAIGADAELGLQVATEADGLGGLFACQLTGNDLRSQVIRQCGVT